MANIIINNGSKRLKEYNVRGNFTVQALLEGETDNIEYTGQLVTHEYIPEIDTIKSDRFYIAGVSVYKEVYGSDDFNILYEFTAKSVDILDDPFSEEEKEKIGDKLYPNYKEELLKDGFVKLE